MTEAQVGALTQMGKLGDVGGRYYVLSLVRIGVTVAPPGGNT